MVVYVLVSDGLAVGIVTMDSPSAKPVARRFSVGHPLHLVLGLSIWFAWLCLAYGALSVACAFKAPSPELASFTQINAGLLLVTALVTVTLGVAAWLARCEAARLQAANSPGQFLANVAAALYASATLSSAVLAVPLVLLPPCV